MEDEPICHPDRRIVAGGDVAFKIGAAGEIATVTGAAGGRPGLPGAGRGISAFGTGVGEDRFVHRGRGGHILESEDRALALESVEL